MSTTRGEPQTAGGIAFGVLQVACRPIGGPTPAQQRRTAIDARSRGSTTRLIRGTAHRGVDLVVRDQGIDTSTAVGRMFFHILGAIAEFEHALMSERTMDGLAAARARSRTGGQKPKLGPRQVALAAAMYAELGPDGKRRYAATP